MKNQKPRQRILSLGMVGACLYLPYSWILLIDYPWTGGYRLHWLMGWPVFPGFIAGTLIHPHRYETLAMMVTTMLLLFGLTWLGAIGKRCLIAAIACALLISVPSAALAYALFWA